MKALDVSKIILTHFDYKGDLITNKKLQKLLYYVEAWCLVYNASIIDEEFEAWVHGPVIPDVYQEYKKFGYSPIKNEYTEGETATKKMHKLLESLKIEQKKLDLIFAIIEKYGNLTSFQLESLSHSERPWLDARNGVAQFDQSTIVISKQNMKSYYTSLVHG